MNELKEKKQSRLADAEQLTNEVQAIYSEIRIFEDTYKKQVAPMREKITQLEEQFLNKWLIDSTGRSVYKGMRIEKDGRLFTVIDRSQQCIFQYLGNARVSALPEGKKRTVEIYSDELVKYTIVE